MNVIGLQLARHEKSIKASIDRLNYPLAKYKFDELQNLNKTLKDDRINEVYLDCLKYFVQHLEKRQEIVVNDRNQCFILMITAVQRWKPVETTLIMPFWSQPSMWKITRVTLIF